MISIMRTIPFEKKARWKPCRNVGPKFHGITGASFACELKPSPAHARFSHNFCAVSYPRARVWCFLIGCKLLMGWIFPTDIMGVIISENKAAARVWMLLLGGRDQPNFSYDFNFYSDGKMIVRS